MKNGGHLFANRLNHNTYFPILISALIYLNTPLNISKKNCFNYFSFFFIVCVIKLLNKLQITLLCIVLSLNLLFYVNYLAILCNYYQFISHLLVLH